MDTFNLVFSVSLWQRLFSSEQPASWSRHFTSILHKYSNFINMAVQMNATKDPKPKPHKRTPEQWNLKVLYLSLWDWNSNWILIFASSQNCLGCTCSTQSLETPITFAQWWGFFPSNLHLKKRFNVNSTISLKIKTSHVNQNAFSCFFWQLNHF